MRTARKTVTAAAAGLLVAAGACLPAALGAGSASSIASTPSDQWQPVASAPAPVANPLKGFMPFAPDDGSAPPSASDGLGYTMEWTYMPVSSVVTGYHAYDFSAFEARLNQIGQRGHQTVFRFYLDYPGRPTGVPQYLIDQGIDTSRTYTVFDNNKISFSPDYNDSRVQDMILDFVRALGEKYDGDARIGFITAGLIGFWGENHTWPMNGETSADNPKGENWMPAQDFQDRLVAAWDDAFNTTAVQYREPSAATKAHGMGYHDDSFAYSTLDNVDWHFMSHMKAEHEEDAWQHAPIGGEVYPPLQTCIFSQPLNCPGADAEKAQGRNFDMDASLDATHATWLMNHKAFSEGYTGADLERAKTANARMGYVLSATRARASVSVGVLTTIAVVIIGATIGALAGYFGGWLDALLSRITDVFFAVPLLLAAIVFMQMFKESRSIMMVVTVLAAFGWTQIARITRGAVMTAKNEEFVTAARATGASRARILVSHIIPNSMAPIIVYATVAPGTFIVSEASLSFMGIGLPSSVISWGADISAAQGSLRDAPMNLFYPGMALALTVLSFIMMGDAVREALDPKARK